MVISQPSLCPWVVVPTYQEAENIEDLVKRVLGAVPQATVLVVDDSSPDGTALIVKGLADAGMAVRVLERPSKSGLGSAYKDGFRLALDSGASAILEIDADLSHDPESIPDLLSELDKGADLVIGSRYVPGGSSPGLPPLRLAISKGGNLYAGFALGVPIRDATSGFRAYRAGLIKEIDLSRIRADGYGFQVEMAYEVHRLGGKLAEIPITFRTRVAGTSKMSGRIVIEAMALCTIWGVARKFSYLQREDRQEKALDIFEKALAAMDSLFARGLKG